QAGPVITVKIPKDRDGRPKQFAFVNFKHEESVPYGLQLLNGIKLYGRPMRIQFRSGSSHAAQDSSPSCSPVGAAGSIPPGMLHPASNSSRYNTGFGVPLPPEHQTHPPLSPQMNSTVRQQPPFGAKYDQLGFSSPGFPPAFPAPPGSPGPRRPKGWPGTHPYGADSRHFGRERFDYGRAKRDEYGFEERGHEAEHHYRGDDRLREGWSHDYDYRRESHRDAKWHPARH
ncbi:RBM7 protein, partial [Neodrepanis coruscans]|nr:RBM7 protein [Neodrepanis coruscans]